MTDLWRAVRQTTARALESGALQPIETNVELLRDGDTTFALRTITTERIEKRVREKLSREGNPFLPYDERLHVAEISDCYVCLLNKFNVMEYHLLLVTKQFEQQNGELGEVDFDAFARCLSAIDGLAFYNSGPEAGASQPHRHLQLVPFPLKKLNGRVLVRDERELPFVCLQSQVELDPADLTIRHREMLDELGLAGPTPGPYNLLMTREWMCVVPRACERFHTVSVNGLGYAGSLFARNAKERSLVRTHRPMNILAAVGRATHDD